MNAIENLNEKDVYNKVDTSNLNMENEVVCWIDIMAIICLIISHG